MHAFSLVMVMSYNLDEMNEKILVECGTDENNCPLSVIEFID